MSPITRTVRWNDGKEKNPTYIFINEDYSLYVSDMNNHRVIKWRKGVKEGSIVVGGNGEGKRIGRTRKSYSLIRERDDSRERWPFKRKNSTIVSLV